LSFIISFTATPIAKKLSFRIGAVDRPGEKRRMHTKPIARFGGAAILSGFTIALLFQIIEAATGSMDKFATARQLIGLFCGIAIATGIGAVDDIRHLKARMKFPVQFAAAIVFVLISGSHIISYTNPFTKLGYSVLPDIISYPLTILWIVGITNAINLIDGLDGLAAGVTAISCLSLFFVTMLSPQPDVYTALLTLSLAGATLGFLPFNFNPAKIIMGDAGAYFIGFTLGAISIQGTLKTYATISIAIPLLVLGLPIFDTLFAIVRRIKDKKPIMLADRGHLHHKLIDMGLTQRQTVIMMYIVSAVLGLCAIVLANRGVFAAIMLLIAVAVFIIGGARSMSVINSDDPEEDEMLMSHNRRRNGQKGASIDDTAADAGVQDLDKKSAGTADTDEE